MIRLLRHDDSVNREEDGAVKFEDLASIFRSRIASSSHWSIRTWRSFLQRGGGIQRRFQYCVDPNSLETFLYLRAIQGHSGGTHIDPALQDNVLLPDDFAEHIHHVGSSHDFHSVIQSGMIPGEKSVKKERHAVFFAAVNRRSSSSTKKSSTTWQVPDLQRTKSIGQYTSSFTTLYLRYAWRKWYT